MTEQGVKKLRLKNTLLQKKLALCKKNSEKRAVKLAKQAICNAEAEAAYQKHIVVSQHETIVALNSERKMLKQQLNLTLLELQFYKERVDVSIKG